MRLDSGASISCIGNQGATKFKSNELSQNAFMLQKHQSCRWQPCTVVRVLKALITYRQVTKSIKFFLIQDAYLGMDFWTIFGLTDQVIRPIEVDSPTMQNLSWVQKHRLADVFKIVLSFEQVRLGRTSVISHLIDVGYTKPIKQRYWPVSPARQHVRIYSSLVF